MKNHLILLIIVFGFLSCNKKVGLNKQSSNIEITEAIKSRGITENLDSLINRRFDTLRIQLQTQKNKVEIEKLIIGKWVPIESVRVNGEPGEIFNKTSYVFTKEKTFNEARGEDVKVGKYSVKIGENHNLELQYDEPQMPNFPKEMLDKMSEQQKRQAMYSINLLNIFEITENELLLYTVFPLMDYSNPSLITHSRLIIERYKKE